MSTTGWSEGGGHAEPGRRRGTAGGEAHHPGAEIGPDIVPSADVAVGRAGPGAERHDVPLVLPQTVQNGQVNPHGRVDDRAPEVAGHASDRLPAGDLGTVQPADHAAEGIVGDRELAVGVDTGRGAASDYRVSGAEV